MALRKAKSGDEAAGRELVGVAVDRLRKAKSRAEISAADEWATTGDVLAFLGYVFLALGAALLTAARFTLR